jgi:hypothetical protein
VLHARAANPARARPDSARRRPLAHRKQHRPRHVAQEQQRIHVPPVDARAEVQARRGAVAREQHPDHLPSAHRIAGGDHGIHRFKARQHTAGVLDRQHRAIHHVTGEMHDAVGGRPHRDSRSGADIDAAMTPRIGGRRGDEGPDDRVRRRHRPGPVPGLTRGIGCQRRSDQSDDDRDREKHAPSLRRPGAPDDLRHRIRAHLPPVDNCCYTRISTRSGG